MAAQAGESLPSHSVSPNVLQLMTKVKVKQRVVEMSGAFLAGGAGEAAILVDESDHPRKRARTGEGETLKPDEYVVNIDTTGKGGLGLDVDWADGKTLYIKAVKAAGAIPEWNKAAGAIPDGSYPVSVSVQPGDRVVAVNDKAGNTDAMLAEVKATKRLKLVIKTPRDLSGMRGPPAAASGPGAGFVGGFGWGRPTGDLAFGSKAAAPTTLAAVVAGAHAPSLLPAEYTIALDMGGKKGLGIDVDWSDGKTLYIKSVKAEGAVFDWNSKHRRPEDDLVQGGDRVIGVNGKSGDTKAMLAECKSGKTLKLLIQRGEANRATVEEAPSFSAATVAAVAASGGAIPPIEIAKSVAAPERPQQRVPKAHEFFVLPDMTRSSSLGLDVDWADGKTLYINSVQPGAVQEWNRDHPPHQQIFPGDRIIAVNGYADDPEAMAHLCRELIDQQLKFQLRVRGPPPPPPGPPPQQREPQAPAKESATDQASRRERKFKEKEKEKDRDEEEAERKEKREKKDKAKEKENEKDERREKDKEKEDKKKKEKKEK